MELRQERQNTKCSYKFKVDRLNKLITCIAMGYFTLIEARAYIEAFKRLISTIVGIEEYTLIVDASRQELCPDEVNPLITEVLDLYMDTPFKERRFVKFLNYDANTQVLCMADKRFLEKFEVEASNEKNIRRDAIMCALKEVEKACLSKDYDFCNPIIDMLQ